jgi:hypothetical protein
MAVAKSLDKNCFSVRGSHGQHGFFRIETESSVRSAQSVSKVGLNPDFAQAMVYFPSGLPFYSDSHKINQPGGMHD